MFLRTSAPTWAAPRRHCAASAARRRAVVATAAPGQRNGDFVCTDQGCFAPAPAPTRSDAAPTAPAASAVSRSIRVRARPPSRSTPSSTARACADVRRLPGQRQPVRDARGVHGDVRGRAGRVPAQSDRAGESASAAVPPAAARRGRRSARSYATRTGAPASASPRSRSASKASARLASASDYRRALTRSDAARRAHLGDLFGDLPDGLAPSDRSYKVRVCTHQSLTGD